MRARGAKVTDVAIIVVAADDGVMPQTVEAIDHAKAADVPMMIAVNKIDKEGATPDKVRGELANMGLQPEDWGGETVYCDVSAKTQEGLDNLLHMILLVTELEDLKANPDARGLGHRDRVPSRPGPRLGRHRPRPARDARGRRRRRRRLAVGPGPGDARLHRQPDRDRRPGRPGRGARLRRRLRGRRARPGRRERPPRPPARRRAREPAQDRGAGASHRPAGSRSRTSSRRPSRARSSRSTCCSRRTSRDRSRRSRTRSRSCPRTRSPSTSSTPPPAGSTSPT